MKLNRKTRCLLELVFLTGMEMLEMAAFPRGALYRSASFTSERNFYRCLRLMREEGWIDLEQENAKSSWVFDITESGKAILMENLNPDIAWNEPWDGKWRTAFFDLPQSANKERIQLRRWLQKHRFGHLQGSVWITHRPYSDWTAEILGKNLDPRRLMFQEANPIGASSSAEYVQRAWNFGLINSSYKRYLAFLSKRRPAVDSDGAGFSNWYEKESALWRSAFDLDPFLPNELLPKGYLGKEAWRRRKDAFRRWSREMRMPDQ